MSVNVYAELLDGPLAHARATGTVAGRAGEFIAVHRQQNDTPATTTLTMSVPMSLEDITAALWILVNLGYVMEELTADGPAGLHSLVLETVLAQGGNALESAACDLQNITPGSEEADVADALRALVSQHYGEPTARTRASGTRRPAARRVTGRAPVGVGA